MINYKKGSITFILTVLTLGAMAQSTANNSSPYSQFGLGTPNSFLLPQTSAMGGIATAINKINGFNTVNVVNPASYSFINYTTIDIGAYGEVSKLKQLNVSGGQSNGNFRLNHFNFAAPVSRRSALSFGLVPYTTLGYNYKQTAANFGTGLPSDTSAVNYIYSGDGGLSKAYFGYGFGIGRHISFGGNASYIFGNLRKFRSTEIPSLYGVINSRSERSNSISGFNFDFGTQVNFDLDETRHVVFGYSGSTASSLRSKVTNVVSQYFNTDGAEGSALDTISNQVINDGKIKLPLIHHFGVSFQQDSKFLIGADYSMGKWSQLTIPGESVSLQDSKSLSVGGQYTPNANALHSYLALIDYRLGFHTDQTYIRLSNTDIKQYGVTFGLGLPLARNGSAFHKINFSAEYGQRGTYTNNLIKENYFNFRLGFTLNDVWFQKYRFD